MATLSDPGGGLREAQAAFRVALLAHERCTGRRRIRQDRRRAAVARERAPTGAKPTARLRALVALPATNAVEIPEDARVHECARHPRFIAGELDDLKSRLRYPQRWPAEAQ